MEREVSLYHEIKNYLNNYNFDVGEDELKYAIYINDGKYLRINIFHYSNEIRLYSIRHIGYLSLEEYLTLSRNMEIKKFLLYYSFLVQ